MPDTPSRVSAEALLAGDDLIDVVTGAHTPWPEPIRRTITCGWHENCTTCLTAKGDLTVWRVTRG